MSTFIEARVIQKVDTESNWLSNPLKLYQGEIAFVSDKYNFKLNNTDVPKTFAELEYYYKGDILSGVLPTDDLANKPNGVYRAMVSGTYSGVVVKEGYYTLLRKKDGVWKLESEVKMPMQDLTKIETELESTKTKVDNFIRDFSVTTDTEFNSTSKNPIANSAVTKLYLSLKSYIDEIEDGDLLELSSSDYSYLKSDGSVLKERQDNLFKEVELTEEQKLKKYLFFKGYRAVYAPNNVPFYSSVIAVLEDDSIVEIIKPFGITNVDNQEIYTLATEIPDNTVKLLICYSDYLKAKGSKPTIILSTLETLEDGVKKDINQLDTILKSFLAKGEFLEIPTNDSQFGYIKNDNSIVDEAKNKYITISNLQDYERIYFNGYKAVSSARNVNNFSTILAILDDNSTVSLLNMHPVPSVQTVQEFTINLPNRVKSLKVGWSVYQLPPTTAPKIRLLKGNGIEEDSVKKYIDNNVGTGSLISLKETAKIAYPTNLIELNFETKDALPTAKPTLAKGILSYTDNAGTSFKKFATLEVQGSSSAVHPKKNWTFALFNDEALTDSFKLRVGNWAYHSEFVFKSNWIDATHARNILSNKIWEDIVQSRKYFPKRENEVAYIASNTNVGQRFDSGALCHVDGVPAKLFVNGGFYGIGMFNLGKKRENYDLKSSDQNHIQLAAETHANFNSYVAEQWEIRNPKTPDGNFLTKINAWFASNALTGQAFKDSFEINHVLKNAIDFFLLVEFIKSPDMYTKNLMVTSWDGVKFYFLPYDMDTTFGLQWDGLSFTGHNGSIRETSFWSKFYNAYSVEIKARYKELRDSGVFTLENVYKHADKMNKTFGLDSFEEEFARWTVPSNSTIYTSYPQIYQWVKDRLIWLDSQYL